MLLNACSMSHVLVHSQSFYLPMQKMYQSMFLSTKEIANMVLFLMGRCRIGVAVKPLMLKFTCTFWRYSSTLVGLKEEMKLKYISANPCKRYTEIDNNFI